MASILLIYGLSVWIKVPYTANVVSVDREPYTEKQCEDISLNALIKSETPERVCINEICDSTEKVIALKKISGEIVLNIGIDVSIMLV